MQRASSMALSDRVPYQAQIDQPKLKLPGGKRPDNARVMATSIHSYITGVPHRIKYLEALLDYVIGHDCVALMTASEIGDWYRAPMAKK